METKGPKSSMKVGLLAVQGAFAEHEAMLDRLGVPWVELRQAGDLQREFDALILPGGESTVQAKLLDELGMRDPLASFIREGMPVLGTCAGAILLAQRVSHGSGSGDFCRKTPRGLATMPICIVRNAYGRQPGSFRTEGIFALDGFSSELQALPMTFVRAPVIAQADDGVEVLARVNGDIVGVRYGNQMALSFHPELDDDTTVHRAFLSLA